MPTPTQTQCVHKMEVIWAITVSSHLLTVVLRGDLQVQGEQDEKPNDVFIENSAVLQTTLSSLHLALTELITSKEPKLMM